MGFQDNLRRFREATGLTAKDFAEKIGIKYGTYSSYETAGKEPKFDTLIKIAAALNVSIDDLLGYKQDKVSTWAKYFNDTNINLLEDGDTVTIVIGSDGVNCITAQFPRKVFFQLMELAEREAKKDFSKGIKKHICNTITDTVINNHTFTLVK